MSATHNEKGQSKPYRLARLVRQRRADIIDKLRAPTRYKDILGNLPLELVLIVAEELSYKDVVRLRCVCKAWHGVLTQSALMHQVILKYRLPEAITWSDEKGRYFMLEDLKTHYGTTMGHYDLIFRQISRFMDGRFFESSYLLRDLEHPGEDRCTSLAARFSYSTNRIAVIAPDDDDEDSNGVEVIDIDDGCLKNDWVYRADSGDHTRYIKCSSKLLVAISRTGIMKIWDHTKREEEGTFSLSSTTVIALDVSDSIVAVATAVREGDFCRQITTWEKSDPTSRFSTFDIMPFDLPSHNLRNEPRISELENVDEEILIDVSNQSCVYFFRYGPSITISRHRLDGLTDQERRFEDLHIDPLATCVRNNRKDKLPNDRYLIWCFQTGSSQIILAYYNPRTFQMSTSVHKLPSSVLAISSILVRDDVAYAVTSRAYVNCEDPSGNTGVNVKLSELVMLKLTEGGSRTIGYRRLLDSNSSMILGDESTLIHASPEICAVTRLGPVPATGAWAESRSPLAYEPSFYLNALATM